MAAAGSNSLSLEQSTVKIERTSCTYFFPVYLLSLKLREQEREPRSPFSAWVPTSAITSGEIAAAPSPLLSQRPLCRPPQLPAGGNPQLFFCEQMVKQGRHSWLFVLAAVSLSLPGRSAISTSTPTPPLQWLNITRLLSGPGAPPLKGASIGYDETTRTLLIFGGESESGFPISTTYLCVSSTSEYGQG